MSRSRIHNFTNKKEDIYFRCEMNKRQFMALSHRLITSDIENEIINNAYLLNKLKKAAHFQNVVVTQWLKNSWNTESVLFQNIKIIENTNQSFFIQWAFPQAYYAVFGSVLALYKSIGLTESTHSAVLKKYSKLMIENKLPESISFCCTGIIDEFEYHNINLTDRNFSSLDLNLLDEETVDHQICQFLRATRRMRLKEKAPQMNFITRTGEKRKKLNREHWLKVSKNIGPTNLIDFLYRKRIKGNYQDIDIYNSEHFQGGVVLDALINIVDRINLVNETYIAKVMGLEEYKRIVETQLEKVENSKLMKRIDTVSELIAAI